MSRKPWFRLFGLNAITLLLLMTALACGAAAPPTQPPAAPASTSSPPAAVVDPTSAPPGAQPTAAPGAVEVATAVPAQVPTTAAVLAGDQPNYGGILNNVHRRWPPSFDAQAFSTSDVQAISQPVYNGLLRGVHPFYTSIEGELAKEWKINPNALELEFTLWPDIKTHNGQTLTADDVKWTLERLRDKTDLELHPTVGAEIDRIEVTDDETFTIFLKKPSAVFFAKLSPPTIPMYDQQEFADHDPSGTEDMAGSGPFRLTEVVPNEVVRFERFDEYFEEGKPYFDGVNIFIIRDQTSRLAALEAGELDLMNISNATGITPDMWEAAADRTSGVVWHRGVHFGGRGIIFNTKREGAWQDLRVRQAINLAINRENASRIPAAAGPGGFVAPTGLWNIPLEDLWDTAPGWRRGADKQKDIDEAVALLAEAGFGPGELKVNAVARDIADYALYHGPFMVEELRQIGIDMDLQIEESARFVERRKDRDYDILLDSTAGTAIDDPDLMVDRFLCGSTRNRNQYCNPAFDELVLKQRVLTDFDERHAVVQEMLGILWEDLWSIPVWWAGRHPGYRDWVVNPPILSSSGQVVSAGRFQNSWFTQERIDRGP